jgi:hypothetical protein
MEPFKSERVAKLIKSLNSVLLKSRVYCITYIMLKKDLVAWCSNILDDDGVCTVFFFG